MDTFALTASTDGGAGEPLPITSQEEKELRRVFDLLCNYATQIRIIREIDDLYALIPGSKMKADKFIGSGHIVDMVRLENANAQTQARIDELTAELYELNNRPDKKISVSDVKEMLKQLGAKVTRQDVEEIVWEVDEDLDQHLSWKEFKLMFTRNIKDKSGLEPNRMYNLTQFLIYDHNENGMVSVDETMNMLYTRYGRANMEQKLKQLFGADLKETGLEGGEISYSKYMDAVERVQMVMFWGTTKGRILSLTKVGRMSKEELLGTKGN